MSISNESTLEAHFHKPLMELFRTTFGLGRGGSMNYYKYSPQRECFVGFDQAFVQTELSEEDFFNLLRGAANNSYQLPQNAQFLGYYLQYKVVSEMKTRSLYTPNAIRSMPHFRVNLDTTRNYNTGRSQHETLYNLSRNRGALVYYACPMVFDKEDLYGDADLDRLVLGDLNTCPSAYTDQERHFIYFDSPNQNPLWCSNPIEGKFIRIKEFAQRLKIELGKRSPVESRMEVYDMLRELPLSFRDNELKRRKIYRKMYASEAEKAALTTIADSLTILQVVPPS